MIKSFARQPLDTGRALAGKPMQATLNSDRNTTSRAKSRRGTIQFNRNELAGAFGDIGTDLPLIIGMILAAGLHSASVLVMFGLMQWFTAIRYGMPMPVQPLKAV